jgi:UDP-N-acetylglucosamine diphosphorylase/glucosamine-1-phosphate N-acetyltransferase
MNYILFGDQTRNHLLPFTFIRPLADVRVGILTIREKWERFLDNKTSSLTEEYLSHKYPLVKEADNVLINASVFPSKELVEAIKQLGNNETLSKGDLLIAYRLSDTDLDSIDDENFEPKENHEFSGKLEKLSNLHDFLSLNKKFIESDFKLITANRESNDVGPLAKVVCHENVFVEQGARIEMAMINASEGPVYIGKDAHIMDGAILRGPVSIGEGTKVRMGALLYPGSAIGPYCKVGGEISNTIIFGYSNKAHDGYVGDSVIGEWCNIGAGSNFSNLKNNYSQARVWDYAENTFISTQLQFCGAFVGDHVKCGINTMLNTGSVIGVNSMIYGSGFIRNFIPSFSWGSAAGITIYKFETALETARIVMERRGKELTDEDESILRFVYNKSFDHKR